ncbi:NAD dependent epimerase/dehydratase family protein [Metarhizium album ARSEF 1941]|uniref:NAD dependent epimerase/dehydratase family protein n=1 Tax=Metarhizium album (strain ARSEF 1941) TaxID=1081103 RepID=A0A0B2X7I8_METAS|nr:NAD dependent epimerase/dehydratase family protein [Metarhizium album ARSEF 1941]KHO01475.1 NAD dependent epimerase/dehydratase family protein [Metarhizium album ARSEF 1941]
MTSNGRRTACVTGATGLLGREIMAAFRQSPAWRVKGTACSRADGVEIVKVDLENEDSNELNVLLDQVKPHVIVHAAAQRFPDRVDKDPEGARALNIDASRRLARVALSRGILLIYISTDYVFPGIPGDAPYEADATPQPTNLYGQTKFDGERAILDEAAKAGKPGAAIVLRVPVLYGHAETPAESAVNVLMESVCEGARIKMDHWAVRYPTNTADVGRVCRDVAAKYLDAGESGHGRSLPSILQFSSEDKMTKYEICQLFGQIMGLDTSNIEANTQGNDPNATVQRPYDCHLSTKLLQELGIDVSTCNFADWWRREVRAFSK